MKKIVLALNALFLASTLFAFPVHTDSAKKKADCKPGSHTCTKGGKCCKK